MAQDAKFAADAGMRVAAEAEREWRAERNAAGAQRRAVDWFESQSLVVGAPSRPTESHGAADPHAAAALGGGGCSCLHALHSQSSQDSAQHSQDSARAGRGGTRHCDDCQSSTACAFPRRAHSAELSELQSTSQPCYPGCQPRRCTEKDAALDHAPGGTWRDGTATLQKVGLQKEGREAAMRVLYAEGQVEEAEQVD